MIKYRNLLLLLVFMLPGFTGLPEGYDLVYSGHAPSDRFYTDHTDNVYFIDDHKIIKLNTTTGETFEYGSLADGTITSADVSNPFQILVFYRDFNRIKFLNNKMSPLRPEINLSNLGIDRAILACTSGKGGFWVFSGQENRLVYLDQQLNRSHHSMIISSISDSDIRPVYMTESQGRLYLHVPLEGILVFDRFASYVKTIPYAGPDKFRVMEGRIIYFYQGRLVSLDFDAGEVRNLYMPSDVHPEYADIQTERLYILSGGKIHSYRIR